jgi:hypothetical protein
MDIQASANGHPSKLLSRKMTTKMLTPVKDNWGLGPELSGLGADRRFGHDGVNEGFQSTMIAYVHKGNGVVVMTNGGGRRLASEIVRAIATDYGWTDLAARPVAEPRLSQAELKRYAGHYEAGGLSVDLNIRDDHLFGQTGGPSPEHLIAMTPTRFATETTGIVVEFDKAADGEVSGFRIVENGPPMIFKRTAIVKPDPFAFPIYVRGSMNDWGTSAALTKRDDGSLFGDLSLAAGDYQFKFGSTDWRTADFGVITSSQVKDRVQALPLVLHGGNIRVSISTAGTYRFELRPSGPDSASFTLNKV